MTYLYLAPAAAETLKGPFAVESSGSSPVCYSVDARNHAEKAEGRQDVMRRAIELLPDLVSLVMIAHDVLADAQERGELGAAGADASAQAQEFLALAPETIAAINAAAPPVGLEPVHAPECCFRLWLEGQGEHVVGLPRDPRMNAVAQYLSETRRVNARVAAGVVDLGPSGKHSTLPYMDLFLLRADSAGPLRANQALRLLDYASSEDPSVDTRRNWER